MGTRKPISSDRSISSHKAEDKEYLVSVKHHPMLYLMVRPNGTKSWLYRYKSPTLSKNKRISLGVYPSVSFARACEMWRDYEELLSRNIDPKNYRELDWYLYRCRYLVENALARLKLFRGIATRYDKLKDSCGAAIMLACIFIWLPLI